MIYLEKQIPILCLQMVAIANMMKRHLLLLVMLQVHRTAVSNNVTELCDTESLYTLYFTSPADGANATHVQVCLYKAVVDSGHQMPPVIHPQAVVCPNRLWAESKQVRSMSYDVVAKTILVHLAGDDDSRFTLVLARTCPSNSNLTDETESSSRGPIQVLRLIHLKLI